MKLTIIFESEEELDGYDGKVHLERTVVKDLNQLAWAFHEATKAVGFDYVKSVAFEKDNGEMVWSEF
jgi:hypothetical protein|tara:strand:- start:841 stop:1041 length:201 start_codon:yes stop_codon:yes gene_type:complete